MHNLVTVKEFPLYMVPLDEDVISFELELSEKVCRTLMSPILVTLCAIFREALKSQLS